MKIAIQQPTVAIVHKVALAPPAQLRAQRVRVGLWTMTATQPRPVLYAKPGSIDLQT